MGPDVVVDGGPPPLVYSAIWSGVSLRNPTILVSVFPSQDLMAEVLR